MSDQAFKVIHRTFRPRTVPAESGQPHRVEEHDIRRSVNPQRGVPDGHAFDGGEIKVEQRETDAAFDNQPGFVAVTGEGGGPPAPAQFPAVHSNPRVCPHGTGNHLRHRWNSGEENKKQMVKSHWYRLYYLNWGPTAGNKGCNKLARCPINPI